MTWRWRKKQHSETEELVFVCQHIPFALAEIGRLQEMLFSIVMGLEPYDARDSESGECGVCYAGYGVPHEEDCGYKLGLEYFKRTRPELWEEK